MLVLALFVSSLITLLLARYAWSRKSVATARAVAFMMGGISWWTLCYAFLVLNTRFPGSVPILSDDALFWFRLMFVGVVALPTAFLIFVLQYTGVRERIGPRLLGLLMIMPTVTVFFSLTDGTFHDWFFAGFQPAVDVFIGGPAFWLHSLYSYVLTLTSFVLLIRFYIRRRAYRGQVSWLLAGALVAVLANVVTILKLVPDSLEKVDLSPFGFMVMALIMLLNIRRSGFLDIMPIARSVIFDHMQDAMLITDGRGRLVDRNPVARGLFGNTLEGGFRGVSVEALVPGLLDNGKVVAELAVTQAGAEDGALENRYLNVQHTEFHDSKGAVRGHIYGFRDVTDLKRVEASLRDQLASNEELRKALKEESIRDPLTGLYNRRWLDETLEREIPRTLREKTRLSLCVIDLDHFKRINDDFGHDVGDLVLKDLAKLLQEECRKHDVATRFGGEEFVLVFPGLAAGPATDVIERLQRSFRECIFTGGLSGLTFSAGLATVPGHARDRETLFKMADRALYQAKDGGRDQVRVLPIEESVTPGTD